MHLRMCQKILLTQPPLYRGTASPHLLCLSHEKGATHLTPFKWWFVILRVLKIQLHVRVENAFVSVKKMHLRVSEMYLRELKIW